MITKKDVMEAYLCLRTHNHSIPDDVLDYMRDILLQHTRDNVEPKRRNHDYKRNDIYKER